MYPTQSPYLSQQDFTHTPYTSGGVGSPVPPLILAAWFCSEEEQAGLERIGKCWFFETEMGVAKLKFKVGQGALTCLILIEPSIHRVIFKYNPHHDPVTPRRRRETWPKSKQKPVQAWL